ncbi:hypothetical protein [uncultured Tateyamaria sp.]|uniref:hypothetical protein n=1 Tax=uncultured Tateyamaria sp. TaxID=455651 RepID=UPI002630F7FF|nr:hypothetical protein [uncultured Tateyamaria sp.]
MTDPISRDTLAQLVGLTPRRISQLVAEGVIPKLAHGKYEQNSAVQAYIAYVDGRSSNKDDPDKLSLEKERARKTHAEANIAEMQAAKMRGDLVEADELKSALELVMSEVKTKLLNNVPTRIAARSKAERKEAAIKSIAKEEIAVALEALASTNPADLVEDC